MLLLLLHSLDPENPVVPAQIIGWLRSGDLSDEFHGERYSIQE
jgi:hypothetical protein